MLRGQRIYYTDGELAFDMAINTKADVGTHKGVYLESCEFPDACGNSYSKILNQFDRVQIVSDKLISVFNI